MTAPPAGPVGGYWPAVAGGVGDLRGWRRYALALGLGAAGAAALPPVHAVPVLVVAFTGLVWLLDGAPGRRCVFFTGWWFGFGHFVAGLYWIAFALLTEPEKFGWMIPFAVGGLSGGLALFPAIAVLSARLIRPHGIGRILVFAACWSVAEWLRGELLTGFPWNPLGNVWTFSAPMIQVAALFGVFGLGVITVTAAAAPAALDIAGRRGWGFVAAAASVLVVIWAGGAMRLAGASAETVPGIMLRLVQPNIAQHHKWRADLRAAQFNSYLRLSARRAQVAGQPVTHVIWPETAAPFFLENEAGARRRMAKVVPAAGALITGTLRQALNPKRRIWNSLQAIDDRGEVIGSYDKFHLVPFGEFVPLRSILTFAKVTRGTTDFSAGPGPRTIRVPGLPPFGPLICYEAIFPGRVTDRGDRPGWLLNVTNDAWFGISSGPYQHFASARMRAVEEGLPLVRAANTGISGVIDGYGRVTARLGLDRRGIIDAPLPKPLKATFFARWGNLASVGAMAAVLIGGMAWGRRRSNA